MNIHSNSFSDVSYDPGTRLLTMIWKKDSNRLDEEGVKKEISGIVRYVNEYGIRNVIVDSREYAFRSHPDLQTWITRDYIPRIMETKVLKYAIIVDPVAFKELKDHEESDAAAPVVDYFTSLDEAQYWIKS